MCIDRHARDGHQNLLAAQRDVQVHLIRPSVVEHAGLLFSVHADPRAHAPALLVPQDLEAAADLLREVAADRLAMHEREVRPIEHVLHRARPVRAPLDDLTGDADPRIDEILVDARLLRRAVARRGVDPDLARELARRHGIGVEVVKFRVGIPRYSNRRTVPFEAPTVERAFDAAVNDLAARQCRPAMRTASERRGRDALPSAKSTTWVLAIVRPSGAPAPSSSA